MRTKLLVLLSIKIAAQAIIASQITISDLSIKSARTYSNITTQAILSAEIKAVYTAEDQKIFYSYLSYISDVETSNPKELLEKSALFFLDKPYVANTLENEGEETLVVNLREFDCTTFVETVIALTQTIISNNPSFDNFLNKLQLLRYREGMINGYSSRLHYMTDWFYDNEKNGVLKNISGELGGVTEVKKINFMSQHRNAYKHLKLNDENLNEIIGFENRINGRNGFMYLPKENIPITAPLIPHMSIIAFTTNINGLDVTHTGFAFKDDGELTFIHASTLTDKVVIDEKSIHNYVNSRKSNDGIRIVRVK